MRRKIEASRSPYAEARSALISALQKRALRWPEAPPEWGAVKSGGAVHALVFRAQASVAPDKAERNPGPTDPSTSRIRLYDTRPSGASRYGRRCRRPPLPRRRHNALRWHHLPNDRAFEVVGTIRIGLDRLSRPSCRQRIAIGAHDRQMPGQGFGGVGERLASVSPAEMQPGTSGNSRRSWCLRPCGSA